MVVKQHIQSFSGTTCTGETVLTETAAGAGVGAGTGAGAGLGG